MKESTFLEKKNKEKIPLANLTMPEERGQPFILQLAKQIEGKPTITLEDKEVKLITRMMQQKISKKLKLEDMVVNDKLEL